MTFESISTQLEWNQYLGNEWNEIADPIAHICNHVGTSCLSAQNTSPKWGEALNTSGALQRKEGQIPIYSLPSQKMATEQPLHPPIAIQSLFARSNRPANPASSRHPPANNFLQPPSTQADLAQTTPPTQPATSSQQSLTWKFVHTQSRSAHFTPTGPAKSRRSESASNFLQPPSEASIDPPTTQPETSSQLPSAWNFAHPQTRGVSITPKDPSATGPSQPEYNFLQPPADFTFINPPTTQSETSSQQSLTWNFSVGSTSKSPFTTQHISSQSTSNFLQPPADFTSIDPPTKQPGASSQQSLTWNFVQPTAGFASIDPPTMQTETSSQQTNPIFQSSSTSINALDSFDSSAISEDLPQPTFSLGNPNYHPQIDPLTGHIIARQLPDDWMNPLAGLRTRTYTSNDDAKGCATAATTDDGKTQTLTAAALTLATSKHNVDDYVPMGAWYHSQNYSYNGDFLSFKVIATSGQDIFGSIKIKDKFFRTVTSREAADIHHESIKKSKINQILEGYLKELNDRNSIARAAYDSVFLTAK